MSTESNNTATTTSTTATDLQSYQQFALEQQAQNNAWSAAQAQKQMDFQKEMSNTAHQREVADLKAAGLNPILSVNSGASVPNGASGDTDNTAAGNVGAILQQVLQAQSAREVAAMYNAATINAASIAANASMYGADMSYWNTEDHPKTTDEVLAREMMNLGYAVGSDAAVGHNRPGQASSSIHDPNINGVTAAAQRAAQASRNASLNALLSSSTAVNYMKKAGLTSASARSAFVNWLKRQPHLNLTTNIFKHPVTFLNYMRKWASTSEGKSYMRNFRSSLGFN